jgi:hypothetical protein
MKKWAWVGGAVVVAIAVGGVIWWLAPKQTEQQPASGAQNSSAFSGKDACTYLTQSIANATLGSGAEKGPGSNTSSDDVSVSTCTYTSASDGTLEGNKNLRSASLLVRAPLSQAGVNSNKQPFDPVKAGNQPVTGYGELAFWDPQLGQLNVYKAGAWLILTMGPARATDRTLDDAKKFADKIIPAYN